MSGILPAFMNMRSFIPPLPTTIGQVYGGGFYAGQISTTANGVATHYLIVAPAASGQDLSAQWKTTNSSTSGTSSVIDGPANSAAMNTASHPAAYFCEGLTIGGYSDWYMPSKNELETLYYFLKPTTQTNQTSSGSTANAVSPQPISTNHTSGNPSQTSATIFRVGNAEEMVAAGGDWWSSTQYSASAAWNQKMGSGGQYTGNNVKTALGKVRGIRRIPV